MTRKRSTRVLAVMMAMVMTVAMMFAMTTTSLAANGDSITVTVKLDTRSYDTSAVMKDNANTSLGGTQVTYANITVPAGSKVWDVVQKVATDNNFQIQYKTVPDYTDPAVNHYAIQDVAQVGENHLTISQLENSFIRLGTGSAAYNVSGWVYGVTPANGIEYFPSNYMDATEAVNGSTITLYYSVTGPYDVNTSNWTADFSNPDVTMWNLYDKLVAAKNASSDQDAIDWAEFILADIDAKIAASKTASGNTTALSAYYFSHTGLTGANEDIANLNDALTLF